MTRTVFLGTPDFAVPSLEFLAKHTTVVCVITQPDRPTGRGRKLQAPPVKNRALELGLEVWQPDVVKGLRFSKRVAELDPDFLVTAAYGRILGPSLLATPRVEALNVHASLLPRYRGAAPVNWSVINGDEEAGISIMRMELGLDSGPYFKQVGTPIGEHETAGELLARLSVIGAEALIDTIEHIDQLPPVYQDDSLASWAPTMGKSLGIVEWDKNAAEVDRLIRGVHPWPCAKTTLGDRELKIHRAHVGQVGGEHGIPGIVIEASKDGIIVACGAGTVKLIDVQIAGRKRLHVSQFLGGVKVEPGLILGEPVK